MKAIIISAAMVFAACAAYADFCTNCGKELANGYKFCPACGNKAGDSGIAQPSQQQSVDLTVNVNVSQLEQSRAYTPATTACAEPDVEHGYKIVSSHVYQLQGSQPLFVPLPGVEGGSLALQMKDLNRTLCGGLGRAGDPDTTRPIITADQVARDQPPLPCLVCEWTYRAVDRDCSPLGVLVTMVNPRLRVMREPLRIMTPAGPQVVERVQDVKMEPAVRVTIWRKQ